jgi:hypothetical protein
MESAADASGPGGASGALPAILLGGLSAGVLDSILAMVVFKAPLGRIYQSVASGLLGPSAFQGGWRTVLLGMLLHFFIATTAAAVYVLAARVLTPLRRWPVPSGLAFGIAVYYFMQLVVLPLSNVRRGGTPSLRVVLMSVVGHALLVGLPIALCARRYLRGR